MKSNKGKDNAESLFSIASLSKASSTSDRGAILVG
jgi:hypothetical protein